MEYTKGKNDSYFHNCLLMRRKDDPAKILVSDDGESGVTVSLNGYAVIPLEDYYKLKGLSPKRENADLIKKADTDLWGIKSTK